MTNTIKIMRFCAFLSMFLLLLQAASAKDGHRIEFKIKNFEGDTLILGHFSADKQFADDTLLLDKKKGIYVATGKEPLKGGVYLALMLPEKDYFQLLVDKNEQQFSVEIDRKDPVHTANFRNAPQNAAFYDYLKFIDKQRKEAEGLQEKAASDEAAKKKLETLGDEVKAFQLGLVKKMPNSMIALLMEGSQQVEMPDALNRPDADQTARYLYYKAHYFDHLNLQDDRLFRTPFLFQRMEEYIEKLTPQHPDSINVSLDRMLDAMPHTSDMFQYYASHYLNKYAKSNIVGFDAVYVHLAEKYYATGKTPWVDAEQLAKIVDNAKAVKPLLIGKKAPNIELFTLDMKQRMMLWDIPSPYTVIYFYAPDCGNCKKMTPYVKEFNEKYKKEGVTVLAVCSKTLNDEKMCRDYVAENQLEGIWMNVWDPYYRYKSTYDLHSTPQIYVLDKDKTIISKRIAATQLEEVMGRIINEGNKINK
jgi:thiol-disulfide isomerase/thioredoxin